jgi:hypothetical protein
MVVPLAPVPYLTTNLSLVIRKYQKVSLFFSYSIVCNSCNGWLACEGTWEFEITLQAFYTNSYSVNVGFVPSTFTDYTRSQMIGYANHIPGRHAAFHCPSFLLPHSSNEWINDGRSSSYDMVDIYYMC